MSGLPSVFSLRSTAIVGAVSLAVGFVGGWQSFDYIIHKPHLAADLKKVTKQDTVVIHAAGTGQAVGGVIRDKVDQGKAAEAVATSAQLREVIRYVPQSIPCKAAAPNDPNSGAGQASSVSPGVARVPVGLGLLYNYSTAGIAPPATPDAGTDYGAPSDVDLPTFAGTLVSNNGQCRAAITELRGWREYGSAVTKWYADLDAELTKARGRK